MSIRILIVDDLQIVRDTIRSVISQQSDMEVVAEAVCGVQALELARTLKPDVVIMDISIPWLNGIMTTEQIMLDLPGVKVIALSVHTDKRYVQAMLGAGALAYISKSDGIDTIIDAIHSVMAGKVYLSPYLNSIQLPENKPAPEKKAPLQFGT